MSVNNKVKVLWKTNCHWRDGPHWPKRKEVLLNDDDVISKGKSELSSLKPGDAVRVKFCSQWYNAEVCKHWDPKESKRGKYSI